MNSNNNKVTTGNSSASLLLSSSQLRRREAWETNQSDLSTTTTPLCETRLQSTTPGNNIIPNTTTTTTTSTTATMIHNTTTTTTKASTQRRRNSTNHNNNNNNMSSSTAILPAAQTRWSMAIHAVLKQQQQQQSEQDEQVDGLSLALTHILNHHEAFRYAPRAPPRVASSSSSSLPLNNNNNNNDNNKLEFCYPPLLSRHNASVVRQYWQMARTTADWYRILTKIITIIIIAAPQGIMRQCRFTRATQRAALVCCCVLVSVTGVVAAGVTILVTLGAWYCGTAALCFLIDWQDVQQQAVQNVPATLTAWIPMARQTWQWLDLHVLGALWYQDREWTAHEFISTRTLPPDKSNSDSTTTTTTSTSLSCSLWNLPPPTIKLSGKRLALNAQHLQRPGVWSDDTVQHVLAVNFCYVMLREHVLVHNHHKQQQQRRSSWHKSVSAPSEATTTAVDVLVQDERQLSMGEAIELQVSTSHDEDVLPQKEIVTGNDNALRSDDHDDDEMDAYTEGLDFIQGRNYQSCETTSVNSSSSDVVSELPWLDVGAKIGMRLLNSAHVHRAVASQETTERLMASSKDLLILDNPDSHNNHHTANNNTNATALSAPLREPSLPEIVLPSLQVAGGSAAPGVMKRKPVHPLWTSASAAAMVHTTAHDNNNNNNNNNNNEDSNSLWSLTPPQSPATSRPTSPNRPPLSPSSPHRWQYTAATASCSPTTANRHKTILPRRHSDENLAQSHRVARTSHMPRSAPRPSRTLPHRKRRVRPALAAGVRVAVPITPIQPTGKAHRGSRKTFVTQYQMGCVVRSERIWVRDTEHSVSLTPNCLSVTVKLERSFLRNGEFADLTFRVMDHWPDRYMPKHSKVPIGSCVATMFGIGVLIGWRVEDDCHIVRSLWRRRGPGAGQAYLNRSAIYGVVEAAVGFSVETRYGAGQVVAYTHGGPRFERGRYLVDMVPEGQQLEMYRKDIYSCHGAQFIPVIEHIRAAANFQMQLDLYRDSVRNEQDEALALLVAPNKSETLAALSEIVWTSFCKAVDEDKDFDQGVNEFMTSVIEFLERLDSPGAGGGDDEDNTSVVSYNDFAVECVAHDTASSIADTASEPTTRAQEPGFWFTNDILGGVFGTTTATPAPDATSTEVSSDAGRPMSPPPLVLSPTQVDTEARTRYFDRVHAFLRTVMKTVSYARVACVDKTHFRLGLAIVYDVLLFIRTVVKVQQKNVSIQSLRIWKRAFEEIWSTVEPIKDRLQRIGRGIAQRMEQQGKRAKAKVIKFVDTVLGDERLLIALEQGDWDQCVKQLEAATIHSKILERDNLVYYRKTLTFLYNHVRLTLANNQGAARRNSEKLAVLAQVIQWVAAPRRSLLKLFERDDVLDLFERILVRVFHKEELASRKVVIHALNFHSLRHLRMLKDFSTSGRLWMPVLDAADEEFSYMVSHLPQNTKEIMCPIASLFSLCVEQFHRIADGDLTQDWMDFLLEDEAVQIIHDIDMKLILALESLSRDVKEMMVVLPYYSNIDDDILNLMDEVDLDEFLKEASDAMDDPDKLTQFIREKATIAVQRFLDWLPRISIPVEKRDLMEGWVLTCRGEDGGDLTLSDVSVKKENLVCQIMGGDALFFPMFGDEGDADILSDDVVDSPRNKVSSTVIEDSVLDHIREMLLQAQRFGCWEPGVGGVGLPPSDRYVASVLQGLPVSTVLNCAIEMWRNLELDDDELLEIAIKDVSYQIQLQKMKEEKKEGDPDSKDNAETELVPPSFSGSSVEVRINESSSSMDRLRNRFNPRVDPTVLYLDMKNLTLRLDNFMFRIEKNEKTLLDPVFEGKGSLTIQNVSIRVRVECAKERIRKTALGETFSPVLILKELETSLEQVKLRVRDTAFGSDWLVNKAVLAFGDDITKVVEENLREQIQQQAKAALENLNAYFLVNPNMLLNLLGISMDDLDDNVIWV